MVQWQLSRASAEERCWVSSKKAAIMPCKGYGLMHLEGISQIKYLLCGISHFQQHRDTAEDGYCIMLLSVTGKGGFFLILTCLQVWPPVVNVEELYFGTWRYPQVSILHWKVQEFSPLTSKIISLCMWTSLMLWLLISFQLDSHLSNWAADASFHLLFSLLFFPI